MCHARDDRAARVLEPPTARRVSKDLLRAELTERLIEDVPSLTGEQIAQVRRAMIELTDGRGWTF